MYTVYILSDWPLKESALWGYHHLRWCTRADGCKGTWTVFLWPHYRWDQKSYFTHRRLESVSLRRNGTEKFHVALRVKCLTYCLNSNPFYQVQHPAAKMIVMASHMQEQEVGDGTNFVLVFAGALLELAEELLRLGLSVSEVTVHFITYPCFKFACVCIPTVWNLSQYYGNS